MKKLLLALCLTLMALPALRAQDITQEERDRAVKYLEKTKRDVFAATRGLSKDQLEFKPAPDKWSVAEVMEHIAAAEDFMMDMVRKDVMKAPPRPAGENVAEIDAMVKTRIPDRSVKAQAPEPLKPTNRFGSPMGSLKHFQESRVKTIQFLESTKDLRGHAMDSPLGKKLDAYQWVLFVSAHTERHVKQIDEVKADVHFPKK